MSVTTPNVVEVTDADFEQLVIEGSKTRPVVVDLWAAWCGPCRTLGPILEKVADEREGAFLLAKLDVDANQVGNALLQAVKSQGIPTVVAFRDGQPVSMFIGAYPEQEVNAFIDQLLPTEAELVAEEAEAEEASGDLEAAEQGYREALEKDATNREAGVGLGRILADRGDLDEARAHGHAVPPRSRRGARALDRSGEGVERSRRGRHTGIGEAARRRGPLARGARRDAGVADRRSATKRPPPCATCSRSWVTTTRSSPSTGADSRTRCSEPRRGRGGRARSDPGVLGPGLGHVRRLGLALDLGSARGRGVARRAPAGRCRSRGATVLDAGAGTGALSLLAAELGYEVTALDLSEGMLSKARAKADVNGFELTFVVGPAAEPPPGPFDAIIERHVVWTMPDPVAVLRAWRDVMAPGGRLVLFEGVWGADTPAQIAKDRAAEALRKALRDPGPPSRAVSRRRARPTAARPMTSPVPLIEHGA